MIFQVISPKTTKSQPMFFLPVEQAIQSLSAILKDLVPGLFVITDFSRPFRLNVAKIRGL
jgi:hypothetical protein